MDGSISFNTVDKTSILKVNNIDILASLASKVSSSNVYTNQEINYFNVTFDNSLNNNKADKKDTHLKTDVDVCVSILHVGIHNRGLSNSFDINVKFNINATAEKILKTQKIEGSTLYDSLELACNTVDKTNILKVIYVDILESLNLKASTSNVYTKQQINNNDNIFATSLNNKADKNNSYLKSEITTLLATININVALTVNTSTVEL